ncbi:MAG: hypothetical protein Q9200_005998 [Gallowayella weberi]
MTHQLPDTRTWFTATAMEGQPLPVRSFDRSRLSELNERCTGEMKDQMDTTAEKSNHLLVQRAVRKSSKGKSFSEDVPPTSDSTLNDQRTEVGTVPSREDLSRDGETLGEEKSPAKEEALSDNEAPKESPPSNNNKATNEDSPEYKYLHSCLGGDKVVAVQMQNDTSWKAQGCLLGFLCKWGQSVKTHSDLSSRYKLTMYVKVLITTKIFYLPTVLRSWDAKMLDWQEVNANHKANSNLSFAQQALTVRLGVRKRLNALRDTGVLWDL